MCKKYELSLLFYHYMNDETIGAALEKILSKSELSDIVRIESIKEIGRYDITYETKSIKNIFICCILECKTQLIPQHFKILGKTIRSNKDITKHLLINPENQILPGFIDYKYPIEMKKYIFESLKMMPRELTKFSGRNQRILALNVKRARELGLIAKK